MQFVDVKFPLENNELYEQKEQHLAKVQIMFKEQNCKKLHERLAVRKAQWEAANDQLISELNAANRPILEKQIEALGEEIEQLEREIAEKCQDAEPEPGNSKNLLEQRVEQLRQKSDETSKEAERETGNRDEKSKKSNPNSSCVVTFKWVLAALIIPIIAAIISREDIPLFGGGNSGTQQPTTTEVGVISPTPTVSVTPTLTEEPTVAVSATPTLTQKPPATAFITETPGSYDTTSIVESLWQSQGQSIEANQTLQQIAETQLAWLQGQFVADLKKDPTLLYLNSLGIHLKTVAHDSYDYNFPLEVYVYIDKAALTQETLATALNDRIGVTYIQYNEFGYATDNNPGANLYYAVLLLGQRS